MVEKIIRQTSKKTWYKWSLYINIVLFFIVAIFIYLLIKDSIDYGRGTSASDAWLLITRDIAFLAVSLALIFFQFVRNLFVIMRRSL
jgi:hypothetical protein